MLLIPDSGILEDACVAWLPFEAIGLFLDRQIAHAHCATQTTVLNEKRALICIFLSAQ